MTKLAELVKFLKYPIQGFLLLLIFILSGCQSTPPQRISAEQIKKLSDQDIVAISQQACAEMDKRSVITADDHALNQRLNTITQTLPNTINNIKINYKIYLDTEPNAWSTANGCIRVNSGLIKLLTDNELQAVIAHEQGHIALKHAIDSFRRAPYIEMTNRASETVVMVQEEVAQQYEIAADSYAFDLLVKQGIDPSGMISMLIKLPIHSPVLPTSHPSNQKRLDNIMVKLGKKAK